MKFLWVLNFVTWTYNFSNLAQKQFGHLFLYIRQSFSTVNFDSQCKTTLGRTCKAILCTFTVVVVSRGRLEPGPAGTEIGAKCVGAVGEVAT